MAFNLNKILVFTGAIALIIVVVFFAWWWTDEVIINNEPDVAEINFKKSSISGVQCEDADRRPMAVMVSSDSETRPLSGLSQADIVFEMPVTPAGVTRMMAVYQCSTPGEIGSIRSARGDFIPLAAGLGAVYVHWGGEREALKKLDSHIIDNIDAMVYEGKYFYRKSGVKQPHNGFADFSTLLKASDDLKYKKENSFAGYPHGQNKQPSNILNLVDSFSIDYPFPFDVKWVYDKGSNTFKRSRGGIPEIDRNNNSQIEARAVVVMKTTSSFTNKDYLSVQVAGEGDLSVYQNGMKISGRWKKDTPLDSKLFFYDTDGKEIEFVPGKIWVEIVTSD